MKNGFYRMGCGENAEPTRVLMQTGRHEWTLIWGMEDAEWRKVYDHKPTAAEVRSDVCALIDEQTEERILTGLEWEGVTVWLSKENQMNFKAAHDMAITSEGDTLPVTLKIGEDENGEAVFVGFGTKIYIATFWAACYGHIRECLEKGWKEKEKAANAVKSLLVQQ